mgnify:FL=1
MQTQQNVDLKQFTTVKSPAIASHFTTVKTREELIEAVRQGYKQNLEVMVIGGGSNTVFATETVNKFVIRNQYFNFEVVEESDNTADVKVSSGLPISILINKTVEKGLEGFEYHQGLPGSVGGALHMNSKWTKPLMYFGDRLISAVLLDIGGNEKTVDRDYFNFSYDFSELQNTKEILVEAVYRLTKADPTVLKQRASEALVYRKETQPFGVASSGCMFQNVDGKSAGELIDKAGLKGVRVGNFVVSEKHANFIINEGDGKVEDLKKLLELVKTKVKEVHGVELKEEVRIIT